jgi:DNA-directed RNA polymerase specialized sigma24 family protein
VTLHEHLAGADAAAADVQALHDALDELERIDARKARIVELRFFGGLTEAETAQAMELSVPTVAREMRVARALLLHLLGGKGDAAEGS